MTVRWKLNLAVFALIAVFLAAAGVSLHAVSANAEQTRSYVRMREMSQFTADIRTRFYAAVAVLRDPSAALRSSLPEDWVATSLDDINVQIMHAQTPRERQLWEKVAQDVRSLADSVEQHGDADAVQEIMHDAERSLGELRSYYDLAQYDSIATTARTSFRAQVAVGVAGAVTVLLLLAYLSMIRAWLVRPVEILKASAAAIGRGELDHRIPLKGRDELAVLARCLEEMAVGLAAHQRALVEAREFSVIGEMCANVAHGLRNPLAALRSGAQLAARRCNGDAVIRDAFEALARQAEIMDQRITRLFDFSRPLVITPRPTAFGELVESARNLARPVLSEREIELLVEDQTHGAIFPIDRDVLAQAIGELVTNAAHHSPQRGRVVVRGEKRTDGGLRIAVRDRGAGMSAATASKAFDPFFTSRPGGSGMGLSLARRAVERHGGTLALESALGEGTTAIVELPSQARVKESAVPA
jgi:signal transduction histidine kinase